MDSSIKKLAERQQTPEEAAAMDASVRAAKRSVGVRQMVEEIKAAQARGLAPHEIQVELAHWETEYPRLFAMVNGGEYSEAMLNAMLTQLEAVEAGRKTTHDASVMVGTVLVNSYVRPQLGMAPVPLPDSAKPAAPKKGPHTGGSQ
jgi:hypothetical protein